MSITINGELETRIRSEATRRGIEPEKLVADIVGEQIPLPLPAQSIGELLKQWEDEDATDDPEELKRRAAEGEEFMRSLARNRLESEGPNARRLWPLE